MLLEGEFGSLAVGEDGERRHGFRQWSNERTLPIAGRARAVLKTWER